MERIKIILLAAICLTAAVSGPAGTVSARVGVQDTGLTSKDAQGIQAENRKEPDRQTFADSVQKVNSKEPADGVQKPNNSKLAESVREADDPRPDGGKQGADEKEPDGGSQGADEKEPDGGSQEEDEKKPDGSGQEEDEKKPDKSKNDNKPKQDSEKKKKNIKLSASVSLRKNGKYAKVSWKKTGDGKASVLLVQRSGSRNGKYKTIARLKSGRSYTDVTVRSADHYYYRVAAKTKSGDVFYSKSCLFRCPMEPLPRVRLVRYSTSSIKVIWDKSKNKKATWYKVYYAKKRFGKYRLAGITKNCWYRVGNLKNNQDYYFGVKACVSKKAPGYDSKLSKTAKMRTMPYERTTIFAGDSITTGLTVYGALNEIAIGGRKSVLAAIGLNTMTFRTRKVFQGKSGTESIVAAKPYRVYIMLGDNDIHYRNKNDLIDSYREIIRVIKAGSPKTDIVILAASPVTAAKVSSSRGFAQIPAYNQALSALAAEMGVKYYDCTGFLKDSTGWLKSSYNAGDGVHWQPAAYHEYARLLTAYDKSLD